MKRLSRFALGTVILGMAGLVLPQGPVYKLKQGEKPPVYSDAPLPEAQERRDLSDTSGNVMAPPARSEETVDADSRMNERVRQREALWQERLRAIGALDAAKEKQRIGEEPLPGERTANVNRTTRLNDAYWRRQAELQRKVDGAAANLKQAENRLRQFGD
jgi:hypothetical protein